VHLGNNCFQAVFEAGPTVGGDYSEARDPCSISYARVHASSALVHVSLLGSLWLMRNCTKCGESKPESEFYANRGRLNSMCKLCKIKAQKTYYHGAGSERVRQYREENRDQRNQDRREWYKKLRCQAIAAYGGGCACCGETEYAFMVFDHVAGGGMRERMKEYGGVRGRSGGHRFLLWLRDNSYPDTIQVLCANCNMAKHFNPGGCPHAGC